MQFRDYYLVLGVPRTATADEVKRAWRKLARKYHPDVSKEADANARMREINEAYDVLGNADKRATYDRLGTRYAAGQEFSPPPDWNPGFDPSAAGGSAQDSDFSDFFESLFGTRRGARRGAQHGAGPRGAEFAMPGEDRHARIEIDLQDTFDGATRELLIQTPELDERGGLVMRERVLQVAIPRGVRAGQQIRLAGQGGAGSGGAPRGHLYLEVQFRPHALYRVDGRDLYLTLPVAPWEAALGAEVRVPTPGGSVDLRIPENTAPGARLRLKGRGIPGQVPGDLYAIVEIALPAADSERKRELYQTMAREMAFDPRRNLGV